MSKIVECKECGQLMDVPAYEGDGVYTDHVCTDRADTRNVRRILKPQDSDE